MFAKLTWIGVASIAIFASSAGAFPPAVDPHNGCVTPGMMMPGSVALAVVQATYSYTLPPGTSLPACGAPGFTAEFGSVAWPCDPFTPGPVPGAFCGPIVPPGGAVVCQWLPVVNSFPTALVIGFDADFDGFVRVTNPDEMVLFGPFAPSPTNSIVVAYPGMLPAQAIAFPTNVGTFGPTPPGAHMATDHNLVGCV